MMPLSNTLFDSSENTNAGRQRTACPVHGCRRVYTDPSSLETHIKEHELPAESLPGKVFLCSTAGCGCSFPNMQKLMEHMRHHHKPNIYFLCENCRTKLRTYKGLLTHLHTCSKMSQSKAKLPEPTPPPPANPNTTPMPVDQDPPQLESMSSSPQIQNGSFPATVGQSESAAPPHLGPPFLPSSELPPPELTEAPSLPKPTTEVSEMPPSLKLESTVMAPDALEGLSQNQAGTGSPEAPQSAPVSVSAPPQPVPVPAPLSPPPSAIWRKNQAVPSNRRILWEHTRGRYTCVQCGYVATNRKDMNQHISGKHGVNKPAEDTESSAAPSL